MLSRWLLNQQHLQLLLRTAILCHLLDRFYTNISTSRSDANMQHHEIHTPFLTLSNTFNLKNYVANLQPHEMKPK